MSSSSKPRDAIWDPFESPLFDSPKARALSRVGVVDIGSNSVRLVVFDGAARSPAYFYNEKIMCALGAGMSETGHLSPEGRTRALSALRRFQGLAKSMELGQLTAVATAAVREARDGKDFINQVFNETGLKIWVIDGKEEARLSAQGVLLGWPGSYGLVCDIGGSSMELAEISGGRVGNRVTSPLGPLKLRDLPGDRDAMIRHIRDQVLTLKEKMGPQEDRLFLVGGSWRALARIDMERLQYPLHVLHEYGMDRDAVEATADFIAESDLDDLRNRAGISSARMSLVPYASEVLRQVVRIFEPHDIAVSSYGIREGMLYEQMPQVLRDRDPLIEACRFAESKDARLPGFGKQLYSFVRPLFADASRDRLRLTKAACLLHDVSWRAHPDYRAETCFDNTTRANLGGLSHSERIFLGLALLHRYSNKRQGTPFENLYDLIDKKMQTDAEILGKALRFAAMLWVSGDLNDGAALSFDRNENTLELRIRPEVEPLVGEVALARFASLANAMGADTKVTQVD